MPIPPEFEWRKHLVECLSSTEFYTLATVDGNGAWSNPVYFAWDENFNIFFISQPTSRHMKNIVRDERVSLSIYSTRQSPFEDVAGIQLEGAATVLRDPGEVERAYAVYYGRKYPETSRNQSGKNEDAYIGNPDWIFVKIVPAHIYYFDTRFFDEERVEVPASERNAK